MFMSWILARIRRELEYRRALRMLSRLTDHQLDDIGLDRMQLTAADWGMDLQNEVLHPSGGRLLAGQAAADRINAPSPSYR